MVIAVMKVWPVFCCDFIWCVFKTHAFTELHVVAFWFAFYIVGHNKLPSYFKINEIIKTVKQAIAMLVDT